jgi:hypothetical protein
VYDPLPRESGIPAGARYEPGESPMSAKSGHGFCVWWVDPACRRRYCVLLWIRRSNDFRI